MPRLDPAAYRGRVLVHWTMTLEGRATGWLSARWFEGFRGLLVTTAAKYEVAVVAGVVMPDHLHLLVAGWRDSSDQRLFVRALRRSVGASLPPPVTLQKQAYDHVLRPAEAGRDAVASLAYYIAENPVRKGLVERAQDWPYTFAEVTGESGLRPDEADFCERWWRRWNGGR
ncbi:hypothetical protein [Actomonas aquatica]|uniref:Transposase IS200-like domain-containing protein n=1 Tax=Actomonas aquatica TaxID=2866162 RepID=A0ABZ1C5U5_9BACT|nr:hypothetical protein [Opitutus sp. WL0086]WRQ87104.1 hypothetical protein K1X11_019995 [Opitutus sp. WL0086]